MVTTEVSASTHKKRKRKLGHLEGPPASVDVDAPVKKKKKKRAKEEEFNLHPADDLMLTPKKKKKKKTKKMLACLEDPPVPVDINTPENKKKRRAAEEEFNLHPAGEPTEEKKKKKKKNRTEECVTEVTSQGEKKKKKKHTSVTMATLSPNHEEAVVSVETAVTSTKEKKTDKGKKEKKKKKKKKEKPEMLSREEEIKSSFGTEEWQLVQELQEFIPEVKKRSVREIKKMLLYDLRRFKYFKQKGIPVRRGRFTREENRQIIVNVSDFLALTGIGSASELFPQLNRTVSADTKRLKVRHHFLEKLAEGIPRPSHYVYLRAIKLLDDINQVGRFSQEEVESLKKLHHLHGNSWRVISEKMGRSSFSVAKRFLSIDTNHGPWTGEEELRLKQAVRDYLETLVQQGPPDSGLRRDQLCNNLPWTQISRKVQTRSWTQCRLKWFTILKYRLTSNGAVFNRGPEGTHAKICLINTLYDMSVEDPADIEWDEVANSVGKVTPMCIQKTFNRLKCQKVPNWTRLSYDEIISFMKHHMVPYLEARLKSQTRWVERQVQYGEDRYDLKDIFEADETDNS